MDLTLTQAADVLTKTEDEVMFLVQTNQLQALVDQESLAWRFRLDEVLSVKKLLEESAESQQQLLLE